MTLPKKITQSIVRSETWHIILNARAAIKKKFLDMARKRVCTMSIVMRAKSKSMRLGFVLLVYLRK